MMFEQIRLYKYNAEGITQQRILKEYSTEMSELCPAARDRSTCRKMECQETTSQSIRLLTFGLAPWKGRTGPGARRCFVRQSTLPQLDAMLVPEPWPCMVAWSPVACVDLCVTGHYMRCEVYSIYSSHACMLHRLFAGWTEKEENDQERLYAVVS